MDLDPQIADIIEALDAGFPRVETMTGAQARSVIRSRFVAPAEFEAVGAVYDESVPGPTADIGVRVYRPAVADTEALPVLVYAHGGGFVFCDFDSHDGLCRSFANMIPAVVVSVDYRLAPEHRWPAAAEDVYAVTQWAARNTGVLGGDSERIVVGGDSAGGNLAAVTALMARDRGGPSLAAQLLLYPVIAADFDTESYRLFGKGYYNPRPALQWYWDQYVPAPADRKHPYASPLNADLGGLPPAVVVIAGHDPLRDEGIAFGNALEAAGVTTVQRHYDGGVHGFMTMPMLDIAQRARAKVCRELSGLLDAAGDSVGIP
jgi:acetyl esterase